MFIERLMNQDGAPVLESLVRFTSSRHRLLAENMVNATTPGYRQKDLSVRGFQAMLRERIEQRQDAPPGEVRFDDFELDVEHPTGGILFHDGNNRSMEQLVTEQAKNALMHNMAIEMLRKQFQTMEMALRERIG